VIYKSKIQLMGKKGRREEGKKGRREEGKKGRREEGKKIII